MAVHRTFTLRLSDSRMLRRSFGVSLRPSFLTNPAGHGRRAFTSSSSSSSKPSPLQGIRILDMSRILAGPFCSMLLGDLGAEIIKIESPRGGDNTRAWGPPFLQATRPEDPPESTYFLSVNRNKKSVCVDFQHPEGQEVIRRIAGTSDVLLENFIPDTLRRYGLDFQTLQQINPRLVYASITGFGPDGPDAHRRGYDLTLSAFSGLMGITGNPDQPVKVGVAITDVCSGLYMHGAIMAALLQRERTGIGQHINASLLETQVSTLVHMAQNYLNTGNIPPRRGNAHESIVPYESFGTKDGFLVAGALNEIQWQKMLEMFTGNSESLNLDADTVKALHSSEFDSNPKRVENREILIEKIDRLFRSAPTEDWIRLLTEFNIPHSRVNDLQQVFDEPQVLHRGMRQEISGHSSITDRPLHFIGPAVKYSGSECRIRSPPPILGEHTRDVLSEFYSEQELQKLLEERIIA